MDLDGFVRRGFEPCRVWHRLRQRDAGVAVSFQQLERLGAYRFGERLGAEVGGADRVRFEHDGVAAGLVAPDGHRQPEREQQGDETDERRLHDPERFLEPALASGQHASDPDPEARRPEEDRDDDQCELETGEAGEHDYPASPVKPCNLT